ncbi:MAG: hypothetical protein AVDCRST_MAG39-1490, partial [uncultured Sphingomonadaceae bacterium]
GRGPPAPRPRAQRRRPPTLARLLPGRARLLHSIRTPGL